MYKIYAPFLLVLGLGGCVSSPACRPVADIQAPVAAAAPAPPPAPAPAPAPPPAPAAAPASNEPGYLHASGGAFY